MRFSYKKYVTELFDDRLYDPESNDNLNHYSKFYKYTADSNSITSAHGIRVFEHDDEISSAIVLRTGGATTVHPNSFSIKNDTLFLCCCSSICALSLPSLDLQWEQKCDIATCFGVYEYEDDLIIHGECEISRITYDGLIKWQFSGKDIFVTLDGRKDFEIIENKIIAIDFQGYTYQLNGNGELIN
jgi:hypothetical protein